MSRLGLTVVIDDRLNQFGVGNDDKIRTLCAKTCAASPNAFDRALLTGFQLDTIT